MSTDKHKPAKAETRPIQLRPAMLKRVHRRMEANGRLVLPASPALVDTYVDTLAATFAALGRATAAHERAYLKEVLAKNLAEAYAHSPFSRVVVEYRTDRPPKVTLTWSISVRRATMEDEYAEWVRTRKPPLFGKNADAKVMALAASLAAERGKPEDVAVLDVGAGTGRNTLPLARAGYRTSALEAAPSLTAILRAAIAEQGIGVDVIEGDVLDRGLALPPAGFQLAVLCEVVASHFRNTEQLRTLVERMAETIAPGGLLLFNVFMPPEGYTPDRMAQELSQVFWSCFFTKKEIGAALEGLPFERVSDESAHDYEKAHLPEEEWPPTDWFVEWATGKDVYALTEGKAPLELRWLTFRRT